MARYLVIVESPAKVKTIKKFLGSNYVVTASNGHVRDMPKSQMGIDIENDYEPKYITIRGKGEILAKLRKNLSLSSDRYILWFVIIFNIDTHLAFGHISHMTVRCGHYIITS